MEPRLSVAIENFGMEPMVLSSTLLRLRPQKNQKNRLILQTRMRDRTKDFPTGEMSRNVLEDPSKRPPRSDPLVVCVERKEEEEKEKRTLWLDVDGNV